MQAALAGLPIAVVVVAMAALHMRAALAGLAGLAVALGVLAFQGGIALPLLAGVALEAASSTAAILWIILPALVLYEYQSRTGALDRLRAGLTRLSDDRVVQALLIAWFFGLFMEGAAGFGTPVALAAPLLVALGFGPLRAVALALLGHAGGVSFGAVGTPALAQVEMLGVDPAALAAATMALHALPLFGLALVVVRLANDGPMTLRHSGLAALAAACFVLPAGVLAVMVGPEVPTLGGALLGGAVFAMLTRKGRDGPGWGWADLAPYALILVLVLVTRLIAPLQDALSGLWLGWSWGTFAGGIAPLYHPGTLLALGLGLAALVSGRVGALPAALGAGLRRLAPVALALLVMLVLARLMVQGGLVAQAAQAATGLAAIWPLVAPAIGVLGTFVSGSATASNLLFTEFQAEAARNLDLPLIAMIAAQGAGAAIGNAIAPHNIIAGAATIGMSGREGQVMSRTLPPVLGYTFLVGLALSGLIWLG